MVRQTYFAHLLRKVYYTQRRYVRQLSTTSLYQLVHLNKTAKLELYLKITFNISSNDFKSLIYLLEVDFLESH